MKRLMIRFVLAGILCLTARAAAEDPPARDPAGGHEWNLTSYLKGTTAQVRDELNGEVERLVGKVKETKTALADCDKEIATDAKVAVEKVRKSADYRQALADKTRAEQELETARKSGSSQERLDAGSRFNKTRMAIEKMENDAVIHCEALAQDRNHSYDLQREQKRFKESLERAIAWRGELLHAIRTTYAMRGPVQDGSKGTLPEATVVKVVDADHVIVKYEAMELMTKGKENEGIQSYSARAYHTSILLSDIDTKKMKTGDKLDIDHVYVIDGRTHTEDRGTIYNAKRSPNETDALFDAVVPLRQSLADESSAKSGKTEASKSE